MTFLDFDRTIFDTDSFIAHLDARSDVATLHGEEELSLAARLNALAAGGALVFSPGELEHFVFPDAHEYIRTNAGRISILTFGNPSLQQLKVENALADLLPVPTLYTGDVRKGPYLKGLLATYGADLTHVDDSPVELASLAEHCPSVRLFEMRRDGAAGDGRWPVIRSFAELPG